MLGRSHGTESAGGHRLMVISPAKGNEITAHGSKLFQRQCRDCILYTAGEALLRVEMEHE
jgi:hypothetical protein